MYDLVNKYLTEKQLIKAAKAELDSNKSAKWSGILYRAIDSKRGDTALGDGLYLTPDIDAVKFYGKNIKKFQAKNINVLGMNSREFDSIRRYVNSDEGWDKYFDLHSISQKVALEAEQRGYEAIYGGSSLGIVVFPKYIKKRLKEI